MGLHHNLAHRFFCYRAAVRESATAAYDNLALDTRLMHSVHLASTHRPTDTRIFHKECASLREAGHRVTVVAPHDRHETIAGVRIHAVAPPADGKERLTRTLFRVYRAATTFPKSVVLHVHDAELLPWALLLKLQGYTVVYDMHEDTPRQMMYQHWIPEVLRPLVAEGMRGLEWLAARWFDALIVAEPVIGERFPDAHPVLVRNFPLRDELVPSEGQPYQGREALVAYVGTITRVRGIEELVSAMGMIRAEHNAFLDLGGSFHPPELEAQVKRLEGWDRVRYHGWLDRPDVARILGFCRVGVVAFHPTERYLGNYPTKLFEYMAAGLPVVVSDFDQLKPFVEQHQCGLMVDPQDPIAIADAITWLLKHPEEAEAMGRRGREAVRTEYNWEREAVKLTSLYDHLGSRGGTA